MAGAVHPRPMSPCTAPILVLTRSFVRSTGRPIPKVNSIGRSKKRKKLAPVAPTEPMPDKVDELIKDEKEAAEEPEFDDEVIEEATGTVMAAVVENMIGVDSMIHDQDAGISSPQAGDSGGRRPQSDGVGVWVWEGGPF